MVKEFFRPEDQGIFPDPFFKGYGLLPVAPAGPSKGKGGGGASLVRNHENVSGVGQEDQIPERADAEGAGVNHEPGWRKVSSGRRFPAGRDEGCGGRSFHVERQGVPDVEGDGNDDSREGDPPAGGQCVNLDGKARTCESFGDQVLFDRPSGERGFRRDGF